MQFAIQPRNCPLSDGLRESMELRLRFAFSRFNGRIKEVSVVLDDLNGPRGGIDKRCRVIVRLVPRGRVAIEDVEADFETAIAHAVDRAGRAVGRELERWQDERTSGPGMCPRDDA